MGMNSSLPQDSGTLLPHNLPLLLLKPPTAARVLQISERKLFDLTRRGAVKAVRVDHSVRYALTDLNAYVESLRAGGEP